MGMSTIPEVITARHADMDVLVLSMVSNVCFPPSRIKRTTVEEVIAVANKASPVLQTFVKEIIPLI